MRTLFTAILATLVFSLQNATAGTLEPVELQPIRHRPATLTVVAPDGTERSYTAAELETFPTYSLTTRTPWRETPANFEGVLLSDILAANGLADAGSVMVTAENDYASTISRDVWEDVDILVATRVDGRAHSRRARGPIQFVIDMEAFAASDLTSESNLVWMAARIEPEG